MKSPGGTLIAIDPYLSNSCKAVGGRYGYDMDRLVPPPMAPVELVGLDVYAMTHIGEKCRLVRHGEPFVFREV